MQKLGLDMQNSLMDLISIKSVQTKALKNKPFGTGVTLALEYMLSLASQMGFETRNYDNYIGEIIFGQGEEFGILCHLDVVPKGDNWTVPAFKKTIKNGQIFGRGAIDNKAPAIAILFALYELKCENLIPNKKIKLILGLNEESGWLCIEHYNKVAKLPEYGFSPDADFPVIYAEKGILNLKLSFVLAKDLIVSFHGGRRVNMVCDKSFLTINKEINKPLADSLSLKIDGNTLISYGTSAHGSTPHKGKNAILNSLYYLNSFYDISNIIDILFNDSLKVQQIKDETGTLTFSPNIVTYKDGILEFIVDIRYPATFKLEDILVNFKGLNFEVIKHTLPLFADKNSELVKKLCLAYKTVTNEDLAPISIGGGTYARALKHGVAFGPCFPNEPSTVHEKNEFITTHNLNKIFRIYKTAIKLLCF